MCHCSDGRVAQRHDMERRDHMDGQNKGPEQIKVQLQGSIFCLPHRIHTEKRKMKNTCMAEAGRLKDGAFLLSVYISAMPCFKDFCHLEQS